MFRYTVFFGYHDDRDNSCSDAVLRLQGRSWQPLDALVALAEYHPKHTVLIA